ncbi:MAG: hypothetical protein OXE87_03435 [Chloroflexi bacterium]|nr:hypothetical protein [Chloroflexota bacterium]
MKPLTLIAAIFVALAVFGATFGAVWEDGVDRALLVSSFGAVLGFGTTFWLLRIFAD